MKAFLADGLIVVFLFFPLSSRSRGDPLPPSSQTESSAANSAAQSAAAASQASEKAADAAEKAAESAQKVVEESEKQRDEQANASSSAQISSASNRLTHPIGLYLSLWGDPYPTTLGVNLAYNVYDWARVNLGLGSDRADVFTLATAGAGVKFFLPRWPLTPILGANLSFSKSNATGPRNVQGFSPQGTYIYGNVGLDWTTGMGLNFSIGYIFPVEGALPGTFYLNAGLFL